MLMPRLSLLDHHGHRVLTRQASAGCPDVCECVDVGVYGMVNHDPV